MGSEQAKQDLEADEVHQIWMDAVAGLCESIGVDPKSFDWGPAETTEETVGNIIGNITERRADVVGKLVEALKGLCHRMEVDELVNRPENPGNQYDQPAYDAAVAALAMVPEAK